MTRVKYSLGMSGLYDIAAFLFPARSKLRCLNPDRAKYNEPVVSVVIVLGVVDKIGCCGVTNRHCNGIWAGLSFKASKRE